VEPAKERCNLSSSKWFMKAQVDFRWEKAAFSRLTQNLQLVGLRKRKTTVLQDVNTAPVQIGKKNCTARTVPEKSIRKCRVGDLEKR